MGKHERIITLCCLFLIVCSLAIPAHAEVKSLHTDKPLYKKNTDKTIIFSGTTEEDDINEIVTVVIYDPAGNFVKPAHSAYVGIEKTFEVKIPEKDLAAFSSHGIYNATAFIVQKAEGVSTTFDFSLDGSPITHPTTPSAPTQSSPTETPSEQTSTTESDSSIDESTITDDLSNEDGKSIQEKIKERIEATKKIKELQNMSQQSSGNKVNQTNENATAGNTIPSDVSTDTKNESPKPSENELGFDSNLLYVILGVVGAGVSGAAVYVIRHKPKTQDYSQYFAPAEKTETSEKPSVQSEDDYALMILKNRLAKGEITIDEFNELKQALKEP
jgi:hypothetical protein